MMIRLTLFALIISAFTQAQPTKKIIIKTDTTVTGELLDLPFAGIEVLDARFDQSKIGCIYNTITPFGLSTYKSDAIFPDSLKNYLPKFINTFVRLNSNSKDSLFVLIKSFRIADYLVSDIEASYQMQLALNISVSFYSIHNNKYFKLFSINDVLLDQIYRVHEKKKIKHNEGTRATSLAKMLYRLLQNKNFNADTTKPFFNRTDIELGLKKRFDLSLYSATLKPGIYKTFEEFKNNEPSLTQINTIYKRGQLESITDKNGEKVDLKSYWGVCDGNKRYMIFREELTELLPSDKGFKILSYRTKADMRGRTNVGDNVTKYGILPTVFAKMGDGVRTPEYFDLNLDSGNLFLEEVFGCSGLSKMQSEILK